VQGRQIIDQESETPSVRSTTGNLFMEIEEAKKKANYSRQMQELTGVDQDSDGKPFDPYKELEDLLEKSLKDVRELRTHKHDWNDEDLCSVCGADGRA
jgi:hypothetical protein